MLAYTVDAADRVGNGVYVVDLATSQSKLLSSAPLDYDQLAWGDKSDALAVLRGDKKKENTPARQRAARLAATSSAANAASRRVRSVEGRELPEGHVSSASSRAPRWTRDGSRVFVGLKEQEADPRRRRRAPSRKANVDVWHWKDAEVQSVQIVRARAGAPRDAAGRVRRRERTSSCASRTT